MPSKNTAYQLPLTCARYKRCIVFVLYCIVGLLYHCERPIIIALSMRCSLKIFVHDALLLLTRYSIILLYSHFTLYFCDKSLMHFNVFPVYRNKSRDYNRSRDCSFTSGVTFLGAFIRLQHFYADQYNCGIFLAIWFHVSECLNI